MSGLSQDGQGTPEAWPALQPGVKVARYIVVEKLGEGGMGQVYKAFDPELNRLVALKIISFHALGGNREAQKTALLGEAQALAQLSHGNVVAVYDAGTYQSEVFIAMEYVEGRTLRSWLKEEPRSARQIREAFIAAGAGLAAAHQAGLVHRDFKPDNVVVGKDGRVRVLDFGLALLNPRASISDSAGSSPGTAIQRPPSDDTAGLVKGTPFYMAPEQLRGEEVGPAADQFSFCVSLFVALYGKFPFPPSSKREWLERVAAGELGPPPVELQVPTWIHAILKKGLAASPAGRFGGMDELLAVLARDPEEETARRRSLWRKMLVIASAGLLLGALGVGLGLKWTEKQQLCKAGRVRLEQVWNDEARAKIRTAFAGLSLGYARDTAERVIALLTEYGQSWHAQYRESCEATRIRGEQTEDALLIRTLCLSERLGDLAALTEVLTRADLEVVPNAIRAAQALAPVKRCADVPTLRALMAEVKPPANPVTRVRVEKARAQLKKVDALEKAGKYRDALSLAEQVAIDGQAIGYVPLEGESLRWLGYLEERSGRYTDAEETLRGAIAKADAARYDEIRAKAMNELLYVVGYRLGRPAEAMQLIELTDGVIRRLGEPDELRAGYLNQLGILQHLMGNSEQAITTFERSLSISTKIYGPEHLSIANLINNLGIMYRERGNFERALAELGRAADIYTKTLGATHPEVADILNTIGNVHLEKGDFARSLEANQRALFIAESAFGSHGPYHAIIHLSLANALFKQGEVQNALAHGNKALSCDEKTYGTDSPLLALDLVTLGELSVHQGERGAAERFFSRAIAVCEMGVCPAGQMSAACFGLAKILWETPARRSQAIELARRARSATAHPSAKQKDPSEIDAWLSAHSTAKSRNR